MFNDITFNDLTKKNFEIRDCCFHERNAECLGYYIRELSWEETHIKFVTRTAGVTILSELNNELVNGILYCK